MSPRSRFPAVMRIRRGWLFACAFLGAACGDESTSPSESVSVVSAAHSEVTAAAATVISGSAVAVVLRARDAQGHPLTRGGSAVLFSSEGGASTGIMSATTDRQDGTYEATFTGRLAGSATTIRATIDGAPVTTPLPAVRVRPGAFSAATSTISVSPRTITTAGTAQVEVITRDAAGNQLETGGLTITLRADGGSAAGTFGPVTDHANGRYTASFTATAIGSPLAVTATVQGTTLSSPPPTVSVARGISLEQSVLRVDYDTVSVDAGVRVTLQVRDSAGVARTSGGDVVDFVASSADGGSFVIDPATDHDDGTYTTNLTGTQPGTVALTVRINGRTRGEPYPRVTIVRPPAIAQQSTVEVSTSSLAAGSTATFTARLRDEEGRPLAADVEVHFSLSADGSSHGSIGPTQHEGDGVYTAQFTARTAGTPVTVGASIGDTTQIQMLDSTGTSHLPTLTVVPGPAHADSSRVSADRTLIAIGDSATLRAVVRDAFGNQVASGGQVVAFRRAGGSGASVGRISPVTDRNDGTYTAYYVADSAGSGDVISATLDTQPVGGTRPAITVTTACTPGAVSAAHTDVTINDNTTAQAPVKSMTLPSGVSTTVIVRVRDARGCGVPGPHTLVFSIAGGSSTGSLGPIVALEGGVYHTTFTGVLAGTATQLTVSVDGVPATTSPVNVTVVPGDASPQTSVLTTARSSVAVGETTELLLEVRDAAGNRVTKGGLTVTFTMAGPTGGTISATTDRGDGTYAALFSATVGGSTVTIGARIDGTPVVATTPIAVTP